MPIHTLAARHARYRPNHTAVVFEGHRYTHRAFNSKINHLANALCALGLHRGDKVATILDNSLEVLEIYQAVAKTGMVVVPLSPLLRGESLVTLINDADSVAVITMRSMVKHFDAVRERIDVRTKPIGSPNVSLWTRRRRCIRRSSIRSSRRSIAWG